MIFNAQKKVLKVTTMRFSDRHGYTIHKYVQNCYHP